MERKFDEYFEDNDCSLLKFSQDLVYSYPV